MNISKNEILLKGMKLLDLLLLVTSFGLSAWIAQYQIDQVPFEELVTMRMKIQNFILFMSIGGAWLWVFSSFGLYQSIHNLKRKYQSLGVLKATTVGTLIILIDSYLFEIELITPVFICLFWAMSNILGILSRLLIKYLLNRIGSNALSEMTDTLYTKKEFMQILEKERIRADRNNHNYSIVLFSLDRMKPHDNDRSMLLQTIAGRVRKIDEVGWYDNSRVGIILPYTSMLGACKLADYIYNSIENISKMPSCEIYTYPFDNRILIQEKSGEEFIGIEAFSDQ